MIFISRSQSVMAMFIVLLLLIAANVGFSKKEEFFDSNPYCGPDLCRCRHAGQGTFTVECDANFNQQQNFDSRVHHLVITNQRRFPNLERSPLILGKNFFINLGLNNVKSIKITNTKVGVIDPDAFKNLDSLTDVILSNIKISELHPDIFASNNALQRLTISHNHLKINNQNENDIDEIEFLNVPNLLELDISHCKLKSFRGMFSNMKKLEYLNVASNNIQYLHDFDFLYLPNLQKLDLSNNVIWKIPNIFNNNTELNEIVLRGNPIETLVDTSIPNLQILDASMCKINEIDNEMFKGFSELTCLNVSGNDISMIYSEAFYALPKLNYLDLSNNYISDSLSKNVFSRNDLLEVISLSGNKFMTEIPEFNGSYPNLYKIDFSDCNLHYIHPGIFQNMSKLSQLILSKNNLYQIDEHVIPRQIKNLDLSYNKFENLSDIQFPQKSLIYKLNLAGNKFVSLFGKSLNNLVKLTVLNLSDCGLNNIKSLGNGSFKKVLKNIKVLILSKNELSTLTVHDMMPFKNLDMLDLSGNPLTCSKQTYELADWLDNEDIAPMEPGTSVSSDHLVDYQEKALDWTGIYNGYCNNDHKISFFPKTDIFNVIHERTSYLWPAVLFTTTLITGSVALIIFIIVIHKCLRKVPKTIPKKPIWRRMEPMGRSSLSYEYLQEHPNEPTTPVIESKNIVV